MKHTNTPGYTVEVILQHYKSGTKVLYIVRLGEVVVLITERFEKKEG